MSDSTELPNLFFRWIHVLAGVTWDGPLWSLTLVHRLTVGRYQAPREEVMIRMFLLFEAAAFLAAASVHGGLLIRGYEHREARIAEAAIAAVLLAGLVLTWIRPRRTRVFGLAAQGFALFWTLVGIFTIMIGIGPQTTPDVVYHLAIVIALVCGLVMAARLRRYRSADL